MGVYGGLLGEGRPTDVTLSWNLIADAETSSAPFSGKGMLLSGSGSGGAGVPVTGEYADRVTIHHNVLTNNHQRNPQISGNLTAGTANPHVDLRNNLIHDWYHYGTRVRYGSSANIVKNIFMSIANPGAALVLDQAFDVYVAGNVAPLVGDPGTDINLLGTVSVPIAAPPITEHTVADLPAALLGDGVTRGVGALPRDAYDAAVLARLAGDLGAYLPSCAQLNGDGCLFGERCAGGAFTPSRDYGALCCAGGTCEGASSGSDADGDGVCDARDNCPRTYNPGQENTDGDLEGGDVCDITVTHPLNGEVRCSDPPPEVTWTPEMYNRFRVFLATDPYFTTRVTSGERLLWATRWRIPAEDWSRICRGTGEVTLFIRVLGRKSGTRVSEFSEVAAVALR
jgi:hypothetical protein